MCYFAICYICIAMAKQQQLQFAFDFDAPVETDAPSAQKVEEQPIVVNESPIDVTPLAPPAQEYILKKPQTDTEIFSTPTVNATVKISNGKRGRKSIKDMEAEADLINIPSDEELFAKQYYPMSVVTQMFNVNHSLLRYWESEFTILQPRKNRKGDRLFRPDDIKNLEIIYHLLRVKKYTIDGAKDYFKNQKQVAKKFEALQQLEQVKQFLLQVKANLS
jgi:DNA-binding transcriptional MerR regulator